MADPAPTAAPELTQEQVDAGWRALQKLLFEKGHYSGIPRPSHGLRLSLERKFPHREELERIAREGAIGEFTCSTKDVDDTIVERNSWWSHRLRRRIWIYSEKGKVKFLHEPFDTSPSRRWRMWIESASPSCEWEFDAEAAAQLRLADLITRHQFKTYFCTGMFAETSRRSGVMYMFRRQRPTIAMRKTETPAGERMRVLAALCLHPIGYHDQTWAGAMVPTDDVIAHLMLMRGDEHLFWRRSEQHQLWEIEAGV